MPTRRHPLSRAMLGTAAGLLAVGLVGPGSGDATRVSGGTFNVSFMANALDYVDPALSYTGEGFAVLDATCAQLLTYPDEAPPGGYRLVPGAAAGFPRVSRDGKTYTFTIRNGYRFSDGTPVRADAFARSITRALLPGANSPGAQYAREIVGADAVSSGKSTSLSGVAARGNRLVIHLLKPVPDFPARTSMPFFCAVPPTLPTDPEGEDVFPGSGPYYVSEYAHDQRIVLERNRYYVGPRPHRVDRFVIDLQAGTAQEVLSRIERGQADWGLVPPPDYFDAALGLARRYGVNRAQFFVKPGPALRGYALNTSRPLFRDNAQLRRAVNFAVDRRALVQEAGAGSPLVGTPTDQYLPPAMPGFADAHLYPLDRPDVARARSLAAGRTRSGKAVLYTIDKPAPLAAAQIVKQNLRKIGLSVAIKGFPPSAFFRLISAPDTPFDIAFIDWAPDYLDPFQFTNALFDGGFIGSTNWAHLDEPEYNSSLRGAAGLRGDARYRAYGLLDARLARDAAPLVAVANDNVATFVSKRVGCIVLRPWLDLTTACLK